MWTYKQKKKFRYNLIYSTNKHVSTKNIEVVLQLRKQLTKHYQKQMFRKREIDIAKFTILIASSIIRDDFSMSVCHVANVYHELHKHGKHSVYCMYLRSDALSSFFCGLLTIPPVSESCRKQICSYACSGGSCPISNLFV